MVSGASRSSPARERSVQVVVLVVFRALRRELQRQAGLGELIDPDAWRDSYGTLEGAALAAGLGGRTRLATQLPAGIMNVARAWGVSKTQTRLNFLTPRPRPAWSSSMSMNTSFLVLLSTATPFPLPLPATKIFMPKLLKTA